MTLNRTPKARLGRTGRWASFAIAAAILLALLVALPLLSFAEASTTTTISSQALKQQLAAKQALLDEAYKKQDALQENLNQVAGAYNDAESRAAELENEISGVEQKIASSEQDLQKARTQLEERLVSIYKDGGAASHYLDVFFSEEDLVSVFERLDALNQIADDDQALFSEVVGILGEAKANKALLEQKKAEQTAQLLELQRLQADAAEQLKNSTAEYQAVKAQVDTLQEEIRKADARAAELARQKRLAAQRAAAAAAAAAAAKRRAENPQPPPSGGGGGSVLPIGFVFPVAGPHSYVDSWGAARSGGRTHKGTDIMSPRNTPVVACVSGNIRVSNTATGGLAEYVTSGGYQFYYAHLDHLAAGMYTGVWVNAGTVIGYVGNSGNASGGPTHLHFGIAVNGTNVNPYPTLRANDN